MLDIGQYRLAESLARLQAPHWRAYGDHSLVIFERAGFPVRLNTIRELGAILDTFQEDRFEMYMNERNGLSEAEHALLIDALTDFTAFSRRHFDRRRAIVPLSTMAAHLAIYLKVCALRPQFESILEIGPGCGYLSFFLKRHAGLKFFAQIEACESLYLLQNMINQQLFGEGFVDRAELEPHESNANHHYVDKSDGIALSESLAYLSWSKPVAGPRVEHFPSWKIGALYEGTQRFDIVTSNANLNEISNGAMRQYFELIRQKLKPDGYFFVQCFGGGEMERDIIRALFAFEFAPLFVGVGPMTSGTRKANLSTAHGIFVQRGHPLWEQAYNPRDFKPPVLLPNIRVMNMIFPDPENRRIYSRDEVVASLASRVGADIAAAAPAV